MLKGMFAGWVIYFLWGAPAALARPEYAVKTGTSCVACHVTPWGGGPRTVYGKFIGSHGQGVGMYSSQDLVSASFREIAYYPYAPSQSGNGLALMEASVTGNAPVIQGSDKSVELRAMATYNMSPIQPGAREVYGRVMTPAGEGTPIYVTAGRMTMPFGLITDEHRTYTRMQIPLGVNDYNTGVAVSGNVIQALTYDLAVVNDFQGSGNFTTGDVTFGAVANMRWQPSGLPFFLGASQNYQYSQVQLNRPYATSLYTALSVDRLTSNSVSGSILFEAVMAKNWNNPTLNSNMSQFFIPSSDSAYQAAIVTAQSMGYYAQAKWDISQKWCLFYKFDSLTLNTDFPGDAFLRHGLGFLVFLNSNLSLNTRVEHGIVTRPEIASSNVFAAQDDLIAVLNLWL